MEANSSDILATPRNTPHELLARLYREIGVSAVATALGLDGEPAGELKINEHKGSVSKAGSVRRDERQAA